MGRVQAGGSVRVVAQALSLSPSSVVKGPAVPGDGEGCLVGAMQRPDGDDLANLVVIAPSKTPR